MILIFSFVILFHIIAVFSTEKTENEFDRYIVSCHTTDFTCFKRQYQFLRDHVLLGNKQLDIPQYQPFVFQYSNTSTCVKITGVEESELVSVSFNGIEKRYWLSLAMPIRIQQIDWKNKTELCKRPDKEFAPKGPHEGPLMKFAGNATMELSYPFRLHKKKNQVFMLLQDETIDAVLDIPDLSKYDDNGTELETRLYEWSEWAYEVVQHVDVAERVMIPYTDQIKNLFGKLPLERFLLLYPSETYSELKFNYTDDSVVL